MKKIFSFAKKKKSSTGTPDNGSVLSVGYELKDKDLGKVHKAASVGDLAKLKQLATKQKNDINQLDKENRTALHIACAAGHVDVVQFLVESKAKLNLCDNQNRSALMKAVQGQHEHCVSILLENHAEPNLVDINGNTALHLASNIPSISTAALLLEHEANKNAPNKEGLTPLSVAVREDHVDMAEFLLKEGADVNTTDVDKRSALMVAASNGQIAMLRLLLRYNADTTQTDTKGWSAEDYAAMNGHHPCSLLISEHSAQRGDGTSLLNQDQGKKKKKMSAPPPPVEAGFSLVGPATNKDDFEDNSQSESLSRVSKSDGDEWASSDNDDESPSIAKKSKKFNFMKIASKGGVASVQLDTSLSGVESEPELENPTLSTPSLPKALPSTSGVPSNSIDPHPDSHPFRAPQMTSTPLPAYKKKEHSTDDDSEQNEDDEEEEDLEEEEEQLEESEQSLDATSTIPEGDTSKDSKDKKRDFMSELGLEKGDQDTWDSESDSEDHNSPHKKKDNKGQEDKSAVKEEMEEVDNTSAVTDNADKLDDGESLQKESEKPKWEQLLNKPEGASDQKTDLMEELGLGDVDDLEDASDWDSASTTSKRTLPGRRLPSPGIEEFPETPEPPKKEENIITPAPVTPQRSTNSRSPSTSQSLPHPQPRSRKMTPCKSESQEESDWDSDKQNETHMMEAVYQQALDEPDSPEPAAKAPSSTERVVESEEEEEPEERHDAVDLEQLDVESSHPSGHPSSDFDDSYNLRDSDDHVEVTTWENRYENLWVDVEKREVKTTYKSVAAELKARFGELFKSRQNDMDGSEEEEDEERAENLEETSSDEDEGEVIVRPMARARQTTRLLTIPEQRESGHEDSEVSEMTEDSLCEQGYEDGMSPEPQIANQDVLMEEEEEYVPFSSNAIDISNKNECNKAPELELDNQEVPGEDDQEEDYRPSSPAPTEEDTNDFTFATKPDFNIDPSLDNDEIIEEDEVDEVCLEGRRSPELELATHDVLDEMYSSSHRINIINKNDCSRTSEPDLDNQDVAGEEEEYRPPSPKVTKPDAPSDLMTTKPDFNGHPSLPLKDKMEPVDEEELENNNEDLVEPQPPASHRRSLSVAGVSDEELEEDLERFKVEVGMLKDVFRDLEKEKTQLRKEARKDTSQSTSEEQQVSTSREKNGKPKEDVGSEKHEPVLGFREELSTQAAPQEKEPVDSKRINGAPARLHYSLQQSHVRSSRRELKAVEETVVRGAQLRAPQTHRHVNGDPLSVFDDSSLSEVSDDEGRMPTEVKKNKNSEEVEMAEDFDDLSQSSDTATDELDCPSTGYRHAALLVEKLDSTSLDSRNMVKLQNIFHEYERTIQKLKSRHSYLSDKVNQLEMEKVDMKNSLEEVKDVKSTLERNQLELQTEVTNLKFQLKQEQENRRNATMMFNTTKDKLKRLEEQQQLEVQEKQKVELTLRNLELEMRTLISNMKQLEEDHSETQRLLAQERSARALQENLLSSHLRKQQEIEEENKLNISRSNDALSQLTVASDRERELLHQTSTLQEQMTILRGDLDRSQANSSLKESHLLEENETLKEQLEDARREVKANSEALTQTVFNCNNQLTTLKSELTITTNRFENERQARETLEREVESTRTRLTGAIQEAERCMAVNADTEKALLREKEETQRLKDRLSGEGSTHREAVSSLSQKLSKAESQANSLENEVHRVTLQLTEKGLLLDVLQKERDQFAAQVKELDTALQNQKDLVTKTGARHEATQERLAQIQSEGMLLRQQLEEANNKGDLKERAVTDAQERFSDMLSKLRSDCEERVQLVEERNKDLSSKSADLRDQLYKLEEEKNERETTLRQLQQELADALKKLSMSEASLEVNTRYRSDLEEEKTRILKDLDRLRDKLTETEEQYVQTEKRVNALKNNCDDKEKDLAISAHKLQEALSASAASVATIKQLEEAVQRLEIENAKLEAAAKQQANKIEALQKGSREAAMVRGHLEELVSNLQSSKMTLEDQLSREVQKQSMLSHTAQDSQALWEEEMKSRSKLGLRLAELEKEKGELNSQMEIEKKKAKKMAEQKKSVDDRLEQEMNRNSDLQKEMYRLRTLLKTAKKKIRDQDAGGAEFNSPMNSLRMDMARLNQDPRVNNNKVDDLQSELDRESSRRAQLEKDNSDLRAELSSLRRSGAGQQQLEQELQELKRHMEATERQHSQTEDRSRQELQHKLEQVNLFLQTQAASQEALEQIKAANQASMRSQLEQKIRDLEGEVSRARSTHRDSLSQRDSSRTELERYKQMHAEELRLRKSLAAKLERANSRLSDANSKLLSERSKSLIAGSFVNSSLGGPTLDGGSLSSSHLNRSLGLSLLNPVSTGQGGRMEDYLAKMRSELDRNISKELSYATEELDLASARLSPVGSASMDPVNRATQQYLEVLKKNYKI